MKKRTFIKTALFVSMGLLVTATAFAGPYRGRCFQGEIPPSFVDACKGKTEGAKVNVTTPRGRNIQAVCVKDAGTLRAMPERFHRHHETMIAACRGKKAGDQVSVASPRGGTFNAVCENWGDTLLASPERGTGFRAYRGELLEACKGKAQGDTVEYTTPCGASFEAVCTLEGKELIAQPADGWGYHGRGYGYGPVYQACNGKNKGDKVSFETPCGAQVDIVCGDPSERMGKKGGKRPHHRGRGHWK